MKITSIFSFVAAILMLHEIFFPGSSSAETKISPSYEKNMVKAAPPGDCLAAPEAELAQLVNKLRKEHDLPEIPVKKPLYLVSKWHVIDLFTFAPHKEVDDKGATCNLHSWSDHGKEAGGWSPVCYTPDHRRAHGMWKKPREIAGHKSNGYELIYWTSAVLSPSMPFIFWQEKDGELDMILQRGRWKGHYWKSMGVGIVENYAAVWFSEAAIPDQEIKLCE